MIEKWRNEAKTIKHYDLLKLILDSQDILQLLKIKKI